MGKGNVEGKGHAPTCPMTLCRELCKNAWTDHDAIWVIDWGGFKEGCIRGDPDPHAKGQFLGEKTCPAMPDDNMPWAVQKQLKQLRCRLGCRLKEPCVGWGSQSLHVKEQFLGERMCPGIPDNTVPSSVHKRLNRSRYHLCCGLGLGWRKHVLHGAHWCNLVNMIELSLCGSDDVAFCQIKLTTC